MYPESKIKQNQQKIENKDDYLIIDLTNILNLDKGEDKILKVENINKIRDATISLSYAPIMVADASMKYHLDNQEVYEDLNEHKFIIQSPAGVKADEYVLEIAKREKTKFLTNDKYEEYWEEFGKDWIFENRLTCIFVNGKFIIRDKKRIAI